MTEYDQIQNFYILKGDKSVQRGMKKEGIRTVTLYQRAHLSNAIKFCNSRRTAVDVGAHYGLMTYNMAQLFNSVHAFEVRPEVYSCLAKNVEHLQMSKVTAYPYGLGAETKRVGLNIKPTKTFSTHVLEGGNEAEVRPLDELELQDVDFIKMDAEGYEPLVVQGAINTIKRYKPVIFYECKGHETRFGYEQNAVLELLKPLGYKTLGRLDKKNAVIGVR